MSLPTIPPRPAPPVRPTAGRRRWRAVGVLSALTLAATVTAMPTSAGAAAPVSRGWNDYTCEPSAEHPYPVILVPGTFGNRTDNFLALAPYLVERGYCVFSFDYGQLPGETLFDGLGPIARSARQLAHEVDRVLAATGASTVDIVGHSEGGMMPRYYLKYLGGAARVRALIGLAPDNHGTTLDGLANLLRYFPGASALLKAGTPGVTEQLAGSAFMRRLNAGGDTVPGVRYTVIATRYDEAVTPYTSEFLSGSDVHNVLIQDLCPLDVSGHAAIGLVDRVAYHVVANALDPATATPTTCASALN